MSACVEHVLQDVSEKLYKQNYYATAAVHVRLKYIQAPKSEEQGAKRGVLRLLPPKLTPREPH